MPDVEVLVGVGLGVLHHDALFGGLAVAEGGGVGLGYDKVSQGGDVVVEVHISALGLDARDQRQPIRSRQRGQFAGQLAGQLFANLLGDPRRFLLTGFLVQPLGGEGDLLGGDHGRQAEAGVGGHAPVARRLDLHQPHRLGGNAMPAQGRADRSDNAVVTYAHRIRIIALLLNVCNWWLRAAIWAMVGSVRNDH